MEEEACTALQCPLELRILSGGWCGPPRLEFAAERDLGSAK
jgi:hypothetical protein